MFLKGLYYYTFLIYLTDFHKETKKQLEIQALS